MANFGTPSRTHWPINSLSPTYSLTHLVAQSFTHSDTHSPLLTNHSHFNFLTFSPMRTITSYSLTHTLIHWLTHSLAHSICHPLTYFSSTPNMTYSLTCSLADTLTQSLTHSFMHSFIHTFTSSIPILATKCQPNAGRLNVFWAFWTFLHHRRHQESPTLAMKEWVIWVSSIVLFLFIFKSVRTLGFCQLSCQWRSYCQPSAFTIRCPLCVAIESYDWAPHYVTVSGSLVN